MGDGRKYVNLFRSLFELKTFIESLKAKTNSKFDYYIMLVTRCLYIVYIIYIFYNIILESFLDYSGSAIIW